MEWIFSIVCEEVLLMWYINQHLVALSYTLAMCIHTMILNELFKVSNDAIKINDKENGIFQITPPLRGNSDQVASGTVRNYLGRAEVLSGAYSTGTRTAYYQVVCSGIDIALNVRRAHKYCEIMSEEIGAYCQRFIIAAYLFATVSLLQLKYRFATISKYCSLNIVLPNFRILHLKHTTQTCSIVCQHFILAAKFHTAAGQGQHGVWAECI